MDILFHGNTSRTTATAPETNLPTLTAPPDHLLNETNYCYNQSPETQEPQIFAEDSGYDSACSSPYFSAPSSPGRPGAGPLFGTGAGFFYSCPTSPMHFASSCSSSFISSPPREIMNGNGGKSEFEFSRGWLSGSGQPGSSTMSSADELFLNGKIRPMKLSTHLERPQVLDPLLDLENDEEDGEKSSKLASDKCNGERRGRAVRVWNHKSRSRRTRSMSPLRNSSFGFPDEELEDDVKMESFCDGTCKSGSLGLDEGGIDKIAEETSGPPRSAEGATSRSSSAGRNSKRWVFLRDFLYRSKSEGRSNDKFWSNISFSPGKERKSMTLGANTGKVGSSLKEKGNGSTNVGASCVKGNGGKKLVNGGVVRKRTGPNVSPHELHYKASKAQAEEMRKRTFLPYRQGLLGCLGFSSKGYGVMNGFARALNPISSR